MGKEIKCTTKKRVATKIPHPEYIGQHINVWWKDRNAWEEGVIVDYNPATQQYIVRYNFFLSSEDPDVFEILDGARKVKWMFIDDPLQIENKIIKVWWPERNKWEKGFVQEYNVKQKQYRITYDFLKNENPADPDVWEVLHGDGAEKWKY